MATMKEFLRACSEYAHLSESTQEALQWLDLKSVGRNDSETLQQIRDWALDFAFPVVGAAIDPIVDAIDDYLEMYEG